MAKDSADLIDEKSVLQPFEQRSVQFYDDELIAARLDDGRVFIPMRPLVEQMGLNWAGQQQRIRRDPVLADVAEIVCITQTKPQGGNPNVLCLPLKYVAGFLFGISADRVKPELREKIIRYQRECYDVLAQAFQEGRLSADSTFDELLKLDSPAAQAYKMIMAMAQMARQQLLMEARLERYGETLQQYGQRLESLEANLGNTPRHISAEQAASLSQAVKALALELGKRSNRNEFGGVYGELYRRFGIPSYRELPTTKFAEAMGFLRQWYQSVTGSADWPF